MHEAKEGDQDDGDQEDAKQKADQIANHHQSHYDAAFTAGDGPDFSDSITVEVPE